MVLKVSLSAKLDESKLENLSPCLFSVYCRLYSSPPAIPVDGGNI